MCTLLNKGFSMLLNQEKKIDVAQFESFCRQNGLAPEKVVFVFPGNSSHHTDDTTLFSMKSGPGLGQASQRIGNKGYPTLSLPTTSMDEWTTNPTQQKIVARAINDLYRALGADYMLMLPVREHNNTHYFDKPLSFSRRVEPSFWGGDDPTVNKPLANHYIEQIEQLTAFTILSVDEREELIAKNPEDPYYAAYKQAKENPTAPWFSPLKDSSKNPQPQSSPALESKASIVPQVVKFGGKKSPVFYNMPAAYDEHYNPQNQSLINARALLDDYTKGNSALSRFFHGHWNRHHVAEVHALVQKIDNNEIKNVRELVNQLYQIPLVNKQGSLARRMNYIERREIQEINEGTVKVTSEPRQSNGQS